MSSGAESDPGVGGGMGQDGIRTERAKASRPPSPCNNALVCCKYLEMSSLAYEILQIIIITS
jgi:hypothetical protein